MHKLHTPSIENLIEQFQQLPGVGRRSAERYAYHILKSSNEDALAMALGIRDVKKNIRHCQRCFNIAETEFCTLCQNSKRDANLLCVIEYPKDLFSIEKSGLFNGRYHVLLGRISTQDNVSADDIRLKELFQRLIDEEIEELILATNPTMEGDATSLYITKVIRENPQIHCQVTRLARGIPAGAEIEFASKAIISEALSKRQTIIETDAQEPQP